MSDEKFPPRVHSVAAAEQGIFRKFDVRRTDGTDLPGGKHHGCEYFVLDVSHDTCAPDALAAYADAVEATHPMLAQDMRSRWALAAGQQWQPIETAPMDGSAVYLHEAGQVFRGYWIDSPFKEYRDEDGFYVGQVDAESFWMNNETGDRCDPTHWQPEVLPTPPGPT